MAGNPGDCAEATVGEEEDDEEDTIALIKVLKSFRAYKIFARVRLNHSRNSLEKLSESHRRLLRNYSSHLGKVGIAIDHNYKFVKLITTDAMNIFGDQSDDSRRAIEEKHKIDSPTLSDVEKVYSTIKQFRREWSTEGKSERDQCFLPLLEKAESLFPAESFDRSTVKVLIPGAGLGRLPYEFAIRGFASQGNEFSLYMLCASSFVLNQCPEANLYTIYPNVHQYCNNLKREDQLDRVQIPDVDPSLAAANEDFTMIAGDFLQIYDKQPNSWDMLVTCFFIDTAKNVVEYLETIYGCIKPGGYWLNFGPLMYHFADMLQQDSIEPSYEDIKQIAIDIGFRILEDESGIPASYCLNSKSMLHYQYRCAFLVCQKLERQVATVDLDGPV